MLVLSRKVDQWVRIGADVEVGVVRIAGDKVRLAIKAPQAVEIVRDDAIRKTPCDKDADHAGR